MTSEKQLSGRAYLVTCPQDSTVLYALDVTIETPYARWFDGTKQRIMRAQSIDRTDKTHIIFVRDATEGGGTYTFEPMTLERYNTFVKSRIMIPRDFPDEDSMLKALENTRNEAW